MVKKLNVDMSLSTKDMRAIYRKINKAAEGQPEYVKAIIPSLNDIIANSKNDNQIVRELNRLADMVNNQKIVKWTDKNSVNVQEGYKKYVKQKLVQRNRLANIMKLKLMKAKGDIDYIDMEIQRFEPLDLGNGRTFRDVMSRAKSIMIGSKKTTYKEKDKLYYKNYLEALEKVLSDEDYKFIKNVLRKIKISDFYPMTQDSLYGRFFEINYSYNIVEDSRTKTEKILFAIDKLTGSTEYDKYLKSNKDEPYKNKYENDEDDENDENDDYL